MVERVAVAKVVEETEVARAEETGVVRVEGATGEAREGAAKAEEKAAACNACHSRCSQFRSRTGEGYRASPEQSQGRRPRKGRC